MVSDGHKIYWDNHFVKYIMSNHWAVNLKLIKYCMWNVIKKKQNDLNKIKKKLNIFILTGLTLIKHILSNDNSKVSPLIYKILTCHQKGTKTIIFFSRDEVSILLLPAASLDFLYAFPIPQLQDAWLRLRLSVLTMEHSDPQ